jgi:hypothetical protein
MSEIATLANGGVPAAPAPAPAAADPGEFGGAPAPARPPAAPGATYEQRRQAQDQALADPAAAPSEAPHAEAAPPPEGQRYRVGRFEVSEDQLGEMLQRQAVEDQRRLTLPAAPAEYRAELPADFKPPAGVEYKFNEADPSLVAARNLAHSKGWSQEDFSQALAIFAAHEAGKEAVLQERDRAEIAKAGINAPQRVDAVGRWITSMVGDADAKPIRATIVTDAHLRFYETIMSKLTSQGSASFSQQHRTAPDDAKIPGYENMSFEQRRFAQDQRARGR